MPTSARAVDRAIAEAILTEWAITAESGSDEWHGDAARLFLMRNHPAQDHAYVLAALAHWAERGDRYAEPHRKAADAFWAWYG